MPATPWPPKGWERGAGDSLMRWAKDGTQFSLLPNSEPASLNNLSGKWTKTIRTWRLYVAKNGYCGPFKSWQMALIRANQEVAKFGGWR